MAGLYVRGVKKPYGCTFCPWCRTTYSFCKAANKNISVLEMNKGPDWCPLVEVPDHGDLIDRDEMLEKAGLCVSDFGTPDERWRPDRDWFLGINAMPTVIPAERRGE